MNRLTSLTIGCLTGFAFLMPSFAFAQQDWVPLFDGKTLDGWIQKNGTATYWVENGTVVGETAEGSPNSFLCTEKEYGNFELEFEVKCDNRLNSGVQIRSKTAEPGGDEPYGRVNGPQVEIEATGGGGGEAGYIYGEATDRGWLVPDDQRKPHQHFRDGQWNKYRVVAEGPRIRTWINDQPVTDLTDQQAFDTHPRGFIALQVHSIGQGQGPYRVAWRNIRIRELD